MRLEVLFKISRIINITTGWLVYIYVKLQMRWEKECLSIIILKKKTNQSPEKLCSQLEISLNKYLGEF